MKGAVLVVGGGIAGMQAALDLAEGGFKVYLVEKSPSIGGEMAKLDKTFPTNDCAICIEGPRMVEVARHPNIELLTYSEVKAVSGSLGNFKVTVRRKPRFIDEKKCTGCEACVKSCPIRVEDEFDMALRQRRAVYIPFPQAVPKVAVIDADHCTYFTRRRCRLCEKACSAEAIDFEQNAQDIELDVGGIIVATGFKEFDPSAKRELGFRSYQNVVTSLQFERILSASGPTGGKIGRPSDGAVPKSVAWVQCVGSRDQKVGNPYCSRVCCMWTTKQAMIAKERHPEMKTYIFYIDIKAYGKGFEEYVARANEEVGVRYIRGRPAGVIGAEDGSVKLIYEDTETRSVEELEAEMLVLASAITPPDENKKLATILGVDLDAYGFFKAKNPVSSPVETRVEGIYLCGCASGPRDVPDSITQASAAAAKAMSAIHEARGTEIETVELPPLKDVKDEAPRIGVFVCHCGTNIGGYLDVPEVATYAESLPGVVYATHDLFACSESSQISIREAIEKNNLNRVVVAACTPRTHESLFMATCRQAGLNKYLFNMINIREQCSWVHSTDKSAATEKAKILTRMAVARSKLLKPGEEKTGVVVPESLVIGGGIAGMTAALELATMGFKVHLVEKENQLGGMLRKVNRLFPTDQSAEELLNDMIKKVGDNPNVAIHTSAQVIDAKGYIGDYNVVVSNGAREAVLKVGTIIVATGSTEINAEGNFGYGKYSNVVTQLELEEMMKNRGLKSEPEAVVIINCVAARERGGAAERKTYCCRLGCGVSIKNAKYLKERYPRASIYVLYRDMRVTEIEGEDYYNEVRGDLGINFVRYSEERKPDVAAKGNRLLVKVYNVLLGEEHEIETDLVVLTVPTEGSPGTRELSKILRVPIGVGDFYQEAHPKMRPVDFATDGIYVCGNAHSPKGISDTISQALGAAARASIPMARGKVLASAITAFIDPELCRGCGKCTEVCEYGAVDLEEVEPKLFVAKIKDILCKGCGACAVACPTKAITMKHFTDAQITEMIEAMLG